MSGSRRLIEQPEWAQALNGPERYKIVRGGRGSAKSWGVGRELPLRAARAQQRILCLREYQASIRASTKQLIEDQISNLGLSRRFQSYDQYIKAPATQSLFLFMGMARNPQSVKSLEGADIAWFEEAQTCSKKSFRDLTPTIRRPGSQLWFTYNPLNDSDPIHVFAEQAIKAKDPDVLVIDANWRDNPWFPKELEKDRQRDLQGDPDEYLHIWEGATLKRSKAQIMFDKCELNCEFECPELWELDDGRLYFGADFGFANDPNTLVRCWFKDGFLWVDFAPFSYRTELNEIGSMWATVPGATEWPIMADSARPDIISMLCREGFKVSPAPKGPGSVEDGITFLRSLRGIKIHKRCTEAAEEAMTYSYKVDPKTDQVLPIIVDANNHFWDACIAEGQIVTTMRGRLPIERVRVGDFALTRSGWRRIYAAAKTKINVPLLRLETETRTLLATPDHRVWVEGKGFTRMDCIVSDDCVLIEPSSKSGACDKDAFIPACVLRVTEAGRSDVYDISVEGCPEFLASGVLVHNCRYAVSLLIKSSGAYVLTEEELDDL